MILFICGTMVGGMIGVVMMCLMQINRISRTPNIRKEDDEK